MSWITQFFLNPSFVLPGAALASVPIIIHLLSRLRYKKIRFAAMEFLLQSDELNRRRLIIEQLLLLLLRVLAVILIMMLLARFILDPSRMMMLRGATTHHVLILDDSLSMRESDGDRIVFDRAVETLEKMLSQGGTRPGSLRVTVLTMSDPERPLVTDRALDNALLQELAPRLRNLRCSFRASSPTAALQAAENVLSGDGGISPRVHLITDLRASDWKGHPEVAAALKSLDSIDAEITLVQVVAESADNVVVKQMTADTFGVAVGVPWRLNLTLQNHGKKKSSGLRATVRVDGAALPVNVLIPDIEAGEEAVVSHDLMFDAPGQHEVEIRLDEDALREDNSRFVVVEVTDKRAILLVDDEARQQDAEYVSAALSADPQLTGLVTEIRTSDVLTSARLPTYDCIYLLNIRELPADATELLAEYVAGGGGVAWFPDDQANTTWYNTTLQADGRKLFPVLLGNVQSVAGNVLEDEHTFQSPVFEAHPIFAVYNIPDSPFADAVQVSQWFQTAADGDENANLDESVQVLARLNNGDPLILEHTLGRGRVLTFLTSAGKRWSNWPISPAAPGYVVMHLLMHQYLQHPIKSVESRDLGELLRFEWPVSEYTESLEIFLPTDPGDTAADSFLRLVAAPVQQSVTGGDKDDRDAVPHASGSDGVDRLAVSVPQANRPGVYRVKRFRLDGEGEETWLAMSVPATESDLAIADAAEVEALSETGHVRVIAADVAAGLSGSDAGREMRWLLLGLLVVVLICEQLLSLRMSFHPEVKT
ncbi:MAG: BatA domain-containing protein [Fuerstiella sp.]|nr:VWA domain-containing protein [Fuerstiella sp.]